MLRITIGLLLLVVTLQTTPNLVQFYNGVMNDFEEAQNKTDLNPHRLNCLNVLLNIKDDLTLVYQNTVTRNQIDEALLSVLGLFDKYEGDLQNECKIAIAEASEFIQSLIENKGKFRESIKFYYPHLIRNFVLMLDNLNTGDYYLVGRFFDTLSEILQGRSPFYSKVSKIDLKNRTTFDLEKFLPDFFSPLARTFKKTTIPPHKISGCLSNASSQLSASSIPKDSNIITILEFFRHFNDCAKANQIDLGILIQEFYQPFVENFEAASFKFIKHFGRNIPVIDSRLRNAATNFYEGDYTATGKDFNFIISTLFQAVR